MAKPKCPKREPQIQIEILNNKIDLDYPCWNCVEHTSGHGYGYEEPQEICGYKKGYENGEHCARCNNTRFELSEEGQAIIDLVKRHAPQIKEVNNES